MISVVGQSELPQRVEVVVADFGCVVDDALGEIHDRDVDLAETGGAAIAGDVGDRFRELLSENGAVRKAAVARAKALRRGEGRELVAAQIHPGLDRSVELLPRRVDLRPVGERALEVGRHTRSLDSARCSSVSS